VLQKTTRWQTIKLPRADAVLPPQCRRTDTGLRLRHSVPNLLLWKRIVRIVPYSVGKSRPSPYFVTIAASNARSRLI